MAPKNEPSASVMSSDAALKDKKKKSDVDKLKDGIENGELKTVKALVKENKALLQHRYIDNDYPLHLAAKSGHSEVVKHLVETYAEAVIAPNMKNETPIYIAIVNDKLDSVKVMFPYFELKISELQNQNQKQPLPGNSLVHAVLEYRSKNWKGYLEKLFENKDLELMESRKADLSALSWLICCRNQSDKEMKARENLAIEVANDYPDLMKVKDTNHDETLPIHQALSYGKLEVIESFFKNNQNVNLVGTNKNRENILHLAAMREDYCKDKKIFDIFRRLEGIYGLVRQKGRNVRSPLELAAWSGKDGEKETNDKFLLFSAQLKKPEKPNEVETAENKKKTASPKENKKQDK